MAPWLSELGWRAAAHVQASWRAGRERLRARVGGQSTVEYALVGALVVIAAAGALTMLGGELTSVFTNIGKTLGASAGH